MLIFVNETVLTFFETFKDDDKKKIIIHNFYTLWLEFSVLGRVV